jgi:hypothetical protein
VTWTFVFFIFSQIFFILLSVLEKFSDADSKDMKKVFIHVPYVHNYHTHTVIKNIYHPSKKVASKPIAEHKHQPYKESIASAAIREDVKIAPEIKEHSVDNFSKGPAPPKKFYTSAISSSKQKLKPRAPIHFSKLSSKPRKPRMLLMKMKQPQPVKFYRTYHAAANAKPIRSPNDNVQMYYAQVRADSADEKLKYEQPKAV